MRWTILFFIWFGYTIVAQAQMDTTRSKAGVYFWEDDHVVFEFDPLHYAAVRNGPDSAYVDFADLNISAVVFSGKLNSWMAEGWVMQKSKNGRYRLRKKITDLEGFPNEQFRLVVNGTHWLSPDSLMRLGAMWRYLPMSRDTLQLPSPADTGNVRFVLRGFETARRIMVTGSFNQWNEEQVQMRRTEDGWSRTLQLPPGEYEYKFIVDGKWMHDPANPLRRINEYITLNSVLRVEAPVRFYLKGYMEAREVLLAGTFTKWQQKPIAMQRDDKGWYTTVPLTGGKHLYKYIVDGNWMTDPDNRLKEADGKGNLNSVLFIRQ